MGRVQFAGHETNVAFAERISGILKIRRQVRTHEGNAVNNAAWVCLCVLCRQPYRTVPAKIICMSRTIKHQPETSRAAYRELSAEGVRNMYARIVEALKVLGIANYEELSDYLQCREPNIISRRLAEMERFEPPLIFKPGAKRKTKRNRDAFVYQLTGNQPKTENELKVQKTEKTEQKSKNAEIRQLELL